MYATGRKVTEHFKEHLPVIFDDELPQWNYRIPPRDSRDGEVIEFLILRRAAVLLCEQEQAAPGKFEAERWDRLKVSVC
jgi:hypothetical protein